MDPNLAFVMQSFLASMTQSSKIQSDHHAGLMARLGDNTALDHRLLTGALMQELFSGTLPQQVAGLNSSSHVPGVQPFQPSFVNPAATAAS